MHHLQLICNIIVTVSSKFRKTDVIPYLYFCRRLLTDNNRYETNCKSILIPSTIRSGQQHDNGRRKSKYR